MPLSTLILPQTHPTHRALAHPARPARARKQVQDLDDFTARVVGSPFALLRTVKFRVPFFFLSALVNRRIQAVRSGK
jgi:hypothetical protein